MSELSNKMMELLFRARGARSNVGTGRPLTQEMGARLAQIPIDFPSYEKGIDLRDAEQDQEGSTTQETYDVEITDRGRLRRAPGHMVAETFVDRMVRAMYVHTSLDFQTELVMFDGEYIGIKVDSATDWYDANLPAGDEWVAINNLDNMLFSNGTSGVYYREFADAGTVTLITGSLPAKTLANFAGRVFAGGVTFDPAGYQALAIAWTADAEGMDWTGFGSGATLLISNNSTDDRVVALRPTTFDMLVAFCQKSVWVGQRTQDVFEPAIFEERVTGVGCVSEPTCINTPAGVIFLAESGVYVFDGSNASLLSAAINEELLPVLTGSLKNYSAMYEQTTSRYWLYTPNTTWIFELKYNRWLRLNTVVKRALAYSEQFSGVSWESVLATWETLETPWEDLAPQQGQERVVLAYSNMLGSLSRSQSTYLDGTAVMARYGFLRRNTPNVNSMFTTQRVRMRHVGEEAALELWFPNNYGDFIYNTTKIVSTAPHETGVEMGVMHTGEGAGAQLRWSDPDLEISKAQLVGIMRSGKVGVI